MVIYGKIINIKRRRKKRGRQPYIKEYLYCFLIIKNLKKYEGAISPLPKIYSRCFFIYINKLTLK